jgi:hypothetical protein
MELIICIKYGVSQWQNPAILNNINFEGTFISSHKYNMTGDGKGWGKFVLFSTKYIVYDIFKS